MKNKRKNESLGSVSVGTKVILGILNPTSGILEHRTFRVVGFKPRNKNNVVLQDSSGMPLLMPLHIVEFALRSESQRQRQCEASRSGIEYRPCSRLATHVAELTFEDGEHKALLLCRDHVSMILDKRRRLDACSEVNLTRLPEANGNQQLRGPKRRRQ